MKKFFDNHMIVLLPLTAWIGGWPVCVLLFHHAYIPVLPWHMCVKFVTPMIAACSFVFAIMGWLVDSMNRDRLNHAFLRKLES